MAGNKDMPRALRVFAQARSNRIAGLVVVFSLLGLGLAATQSNAQVAGDFTLSVAPSAQSLTPGSTTKFYVETTSIGGLTTQINLVASGLPAGVSATFSPVKVTPGSASFLTITAAAAATLGNFNVTVTGTAGTVSHAASGAVSVVNGLIPKCLVPVSGVVTDSVSGLPIDAAKVVAGAFSVTTNPAGEFTFTGLEMGPNNAPLAVTFTVSKDTPAVDRIGTYWPKTAQNVLVCGRPVTLNVKLVKSLPAQLTANIVEGAIEGGAYDQPVPKVPAAGVPGVLLSVSGIGGENSAADGTLTMKDSTGALGMHVGTDNAPLTSTAKLSTSTNFPIRKRYWMPPSLPFGPLAPGGSVDLGTIPVVRQCTAAVTGVVTDGPGGAPLSGVKLVVTPTTTPTLDTATVTTSTDGKFAFPEILFGYNNEPGTVTVTATRTGYATLALPSAELTCNATSAVTMPMISTAVPFKIGSVQGRIVDKDTGLPVAGITPKLTPCAVTVPVGCVATASDAAGNYTIANVPVGPTDTSVLAASVAPVFVASPPDYWPASVAVTVKVGSASLAPDIKILKRKFGAVNGVVRDSASKLPLEGAKMATTGATRVPCTAPCVTGPDGRYSFTSVELGTDNVSRSTSVTSALADYWNKSSPVTYEAGITKVVDVDLVKVCAPAKIHGQVVDAVTKAPIVGALLSVPNLTGSTLPALPAKPTAVTDAAGNYEVAEVYPGLDNVDRLAPVTASAGGYYNGILTPLVACGADIQLNFGFTPTISSLNPNTGPTAGGTVVTINGKDLLGITSATFDGIPATNVTSVSDTQAKVTSPAHLAGAVDVKVTTGGGTSAPSSASRFTYVGLPPTTTTTTTTSTTTSTSTTTVPPTTTTTSTTTTVPPTTTTVPPTTTTTSTTTTVPVTTTTVPATTTTTIPPTPQEVITAVVIAAAVAYALWLIFGQWFGTPAP